MFVIDFMPVSDCQLTCKYRCLRAATLHPARGRIVVLELQHSASRSRSNCTAHARRCSGYICNDDVCGFHPVLYATHSKMYALPIIDARGR